MVKIHNRLIAMLTAATVLAVMLASCTSQNTGNNAVSDAQSSSVSSSADSTAQSEAASSSSELTVSSAVTASASSAVSSKSSFDDKTLTHQFTNNAASSTSKSVKKASSSKSTAASSKPQVSSAKTAASSSSKPATSSSSQSASSSQPKTPTTGFVITTQPATVNSSTDLTVNGTSYGLTTPMWYEVHQGDASGKMEDYGSFAPDANWFFKARHLNEGANTILVFAQMPDGTTTSSKLTINLNTGNNPTISPRPQPAEIWWGGLGQNQQLMDDPNGWLYVKKYADGYFFHTFYWGDAQNDIMKSVIAQVKPYGTKLVAELGGSTGNYDNWPYDMHNVWGTGPNGWVTSKYNKNGLILSEISHDFHDNSIDIANAFPGISASDLVNKIGDYWSRYFNYNNAATPYLKQADTWSPVWWWWNNYPPLGGEKRNNLAFTADNGQSYKLNGFDIVNALINAGSNIGGVHSQYSFFIDSPYYTLTWNEGNNEGAAYLRKIIAFQQWIQSTGSRCTFVCNEDPGTALADKSHDDWDKQYAVNSLKSLQLYQSRGGRADTYNFESWYADSSGLTLPYKVTSEDTQYSYTWLAKQAIKYLKGIKDDGSYDQLSMTKTQSGNQTTITITNNGEVACMPAFVASETGDSKITTTWIDNFGRDVTSQIKSPEGWVYNTINMLKPGESFKITCTTDNPGGATGKTVDIKAFWNPQDPTGYVRSDVNWSVK